MKWTFKQAPHAESLLRAIFPAELSAHLRWGTLTVEDSGHVNTALRTRHGDLVLSVALRDGPGRLYTLLEQQRKVERRMILRTADYLIRTWQKLAVIREGGRRLPPVIPIVLYNGRRPWTAPMTLQDLVHLPDGAPAPGAAPSSTWLSRHIPQFEMHLVDLHRGRMSGVVESELTPLSRVVLWCLSVAGDDARFERGIGRMAGALNEVLRGPDATDALEVLLEYLAATHPRLPAETIRATVEKVMAPAGQEVIVSFREEIGKEARQEGRREGRRDALSRMLLAQMAYRFGRVPKEAQARVREAPEATLRRWTLRVLDAASIDDVLRDKRPARRPGDTSTARPARRALSGSRSRS